MADEGDYVEAQRRGPEDPPMYPDSVDRLVFGPSSDLSEAVQEARRILSPDPGRKAALHERIEAAWHVLTAALPDQEAERARDDDG